MTTPINQEALANQITSLTGGPKGVTETLPEAAIDVKGGVGGSLEIAAIGGAKKKKNTPFVNSLSSAGANTELIEAVEALQSGNAASAQAFKSNVADFIDSGASTSQAEVPVFRQTLEDIPLQDFSTLDPLVARTATNTFDPIEGTFDTGQTTAPTDLLADFAGTSNQISPLATDTTRGAVGTANLLTNVVRATTVGGQNFADVSKNVATNFFNNSVLLGAPQAFNAAKSLVNTTGVNSTLGNLDKAGAFIALDQFGRGMSRRFTRANSPEEFFTNLKDEIGDRVKGVAEFITDPVSAIKGLANVFTYGAANPDVTAIDLAHGKISYVLDENGSLVTPGFISAIMGMAPVVSNVTSSIQYGLKNFTDYYPDLKDRYERLASAAQVGGFKYDEDTATYSNGTDNYVNTGTTIDGESFSGKWNTSFNLNTFAQEFPNVTLADLKNMAGESSYFDMSGHFTDGNLLYTGPEQAQASGHVISTLSNHAQRLGLSDQTPIAELNQEVGNIHKPAIETYYRNFEDFFVASNRPSAFMPEGSTELNQLDPRTYYKDMEFTPKMTRDFMRDSYLNYSDFTDQSLQSEDYFPKIGNIMDSTSAEAEQWHDFVVGASEFNYQGFNQEATDIAQTARDLTGRTFTAFGFDPRDKEYTAQLGTLRAMGTVLDKKTIETVARSVYLGEDVDPKNLNNPSVSIANADSEVNNILDMLNKQADSIFLGTGDRPVPDISDEFRGEELFPVTGEFAQGTADAKTELEAASRADTQTIKTGINSVGGFLEQAVNFSKDSSKSVVNTVEKIRDGMNIIDNQLKNMKDTADITTFKNRELFNRARSQLAGNMQTIVDSVTKMNQPSGSEFTLPDRLEPADLFQPATDDRYLPSEVDQPSGSEFTLPDRPADPEGMTTIGGLGDKAVTAGRLSAPVADMLGGKNEQLQTELAMLQDAANEPDPKTDPNIVELDKDSAKGIDFRSPAGQPLSLAPPAPQNTNLEDIQEKQTINGKVESKSGNNAVVLTPDGSRVEITNAVVNAKVGESVKSNSISVSKDTEIQVRNDKGKLLSQNELKNKDSLKNFLIEIKKDTMHMIGGTIKLVDHMLSGPTKEQIDRQDVEDFYGGPFVGDIIESESGIFGTGLRVGASLDPRGGAKVAGISMDEYGNFYNAAGELIADPDAQPALTVRASGRETSGAIGRAGPIPTVLEFVRDAAADIFGGEFKLTPDDDKDPLAPVDVVPYDAETRGGNEPVPVAPPTAPDLEELAAQAGGAVAQSVIDDDAGVSDAAGADAGSFGGEGGGYSGDEGGLW